MGVMVVMEIEEEMATEVMEAVETEIEDPAEG